ncbi:MAG: hypothetical protein Q7U60_10875 [Candidatus Methanoperedens sp.]|nr:hypothetical protein [Candidatus Methanoperedens sp.]
MTQTDYVKEQLALLKLLMTGVSGAMLAVVVYNIQTSGANVLNVMAAVIIFCVVFFYLSRAYTKLLDELKDLP